MCVSVVYHCTSGWFLSAAPPPPPPYPRIKIVPKRYGQFYSFVRTPEKQDSRLKMAGTRSTNENWCVTIRRKIMFYFRHTCLYILALLISSPLERLFQTWKCIKRKHKVIVKCHWFRQSQDEKEEPNWICLLSLEWMMSFCSLFVNWSEWKSVSFGFADWPLLILLYITLLKWFLVEYC